jgi:hypothetical protein
MLPDGDGFSLPLAGAVKGGHVAAAAAAAGGRGCVGIQLAGRRGCRLCYAGNWCGCVCRVAALLPATESSNSFLDPPGLGISIVLLWHSGMRVLEAGFSGQGRSKTKTVGHVMRGQRDGLRTLLVSGPCVAGDLLDCRGSGQRGGSSQERHRHVEACRQR